ncbi:MAG: lipid-A-disaccharide synthase [Deltaproteobacteria bacterium]|nr:lipid-A-disaccharide synthase [Deltaproteobacteria bacterium]
MKRLLLAVGEASGDALAAALLPRLRALAPDLEVRAVAGPRLRSAGVEVLARAEAVTAVGLVEVAGVLPSALRLLRLVDRELERWRPDALLTVDSPDLMLRVAALGRAKGVRTVHLVSPQVWAWRPGRVREVARCVDTLLCLFPHEPALYRGLGVRAVFVGHPAAERLRALPSPRLPGVVALLPGSREREVRALWPVYREVVRLLREAAPGLEVEILRAPTVESAWLSGVGGALVEDVAALRAEVALVASGTATLELALRGLPMVVAYQVHPLTWEVGRRLVRVRHLSLPNLLVEAPVVPEHLQRLDPPALAASLLQTAAAPDAQRSAFAGLAARLDPGDALGRMAAEVMARGPRLV